MIYKMEDIYETGGVISSIYGLRNEPNTYQITVPVNLHPNMPANCTEKYIAKNDSSMSIHTPYSDIHLPSFGVAFCAGTSPR